MLEIIERLCVWVSDKERLEDAKKWLGQMRLILSTKTDKDEIAYVQSKIDLFEWMIEQAELLEEKEKERAEWKGRYTKEKNAHKRYKNDMKYKWRRFRAAENKIDALENEIYLRGEVATQNYFEYQERLYEIDELEQQNKRYREALKKIVSVKNDEEFNPYNYMVLEIIDWAEQALESESNE